MKKIYKYELDPAREQWVFDIPGRNPSVLTVQWQGGEMCAWIQFDVSEPSLTSLPPLPSLCRIRMYGTGWPIYEDARYICTVQDGTFVWHYYQEA